MDKVWFSLFVLFVLVPCVLPARYVPKWKKQACEIPSSQTEHSHYICTDDGEIKCLPGWTGDLCDVPKCRPGCDPFQGYCNRPGECLCRLGYYGDKCNKCIPLPGCQHGYCNVSFECICKPGWDGLFCSELIQSKCPFSKNYNKNMYKVVHPPKEIQGSNIKASQSSYFGKFFMKKIKPLVDQIVIPLEVTAMLQETVDVVLDGQAKHAAIVKSYLDVKMGTAISRWSVNQSVPKHVTRKGVIVGNLENVVLPQHLLISLDVGVPASRMLIREKETTMISHCNRTRQQGYRQSCKVGWFGKNCEKCFPYPGCVNGTCHRPWECNCKKGWGGMLCDEELNHCENNPNTCKNGAKCISMIKSEGSYRCLCREGTFGRNCELSELTTTLKPKPNQMTTNATISTVNITSTTATSSTTTTTTTEGMVSSTEVTEIPTTELNDLVINNETK
ncbi:unnamed protein product [Brassicogethes aeneus]|uniref:EGF-like domain-containing protein n=1 Tax=Brassicogethes aeneus TaxID=1431903 RepID=A0A9P0BDU4_BRAAE|nr:unnamed protein product [Brassicogethes aeneus]